jgi:hypothetical protein
VKASSRSDTSQTKTLTPTCAIVPAFRLVSQGRHLGQREPNNSNPRDYQEEAPWSNPTRTCLAAGSDTSCTPTATQSWRSRTPGSSNLPAARLRTLCPRA